MSGTFLTDYIVLCSFYVPKPYALNLTIRPHRADRQDSPKHAVVRGGRRPGTHLSLCVSYGSGFRAYLRGSFYDSHKSSYKGFP